MRLPGGGGAPEIATSAHEVFITMAQGQRSFVEKVDFVTSLGHGSGKGSREKLGVTTKGPTRVMTDLCVLEPDAETSELTVTAIHPGVTREQIVDATGWAVKFAAKVADNIAADRAGVVGAARIARAYQGRERGAEVMAALLAYPVIPAKRSAERESSSGS